MKVKQSDIEAAVKETDQQRKNTRWQPAKITLGKNVKCIHNMCDLFQ